MSDCDELLRWALPRMRMRWTGFRKVRGQVSKRLRRRIRELSLTSFSDYRARLMSDADEWLILDSCCRITISRFYRERDAWERLREEIEGRERLRCWCAGAASGEEPYTLALLCRFAGIPVRVLATEADPHLLERARDGRYPRSSLGEVPPEWLEAAFTRESDRFVMRPEHKEPVEWRLEDIRLSLPDGPFDLVLCRYLAFTYYDEELQREVLARLRARLAPGGLLVLGAKERLPASELTMLAPGLYRRGDGP